MLCYITRVDHICIGLVEQTTKKRQLALLTQLDQLDQECTALKEETAKIREQRQKLQEEVDVLSLSNEELQLQYKDKDVSLSYICFVLLQH